MKKKTRADFQGAYKIGRNPAGMIKDNADSWNQVKNVINERKGIADFEELSIAVSAHQSGSSNAEKPYRFVTYCIREGWLKRTNEASYKNYLYSTNAAGSGKASSYVMAIRLLSKMISVAPMGFSDCIDLWSIESIERLEQLYDITRTQMRLGGASPWCLDGIPRSYLEKGFCLAAIKNYQKYLIEQDFERSLLNNLEYSERLDNRQETDFIYAGTLTDGLSEKKGRDVIRQVKVRCHQNVFRKMVFQNYNSTCCISGLNIPALNIASHIIPWAEDKEFRLDPRNGLCLSATYDKAFDRHLISFDDDYRMIVSKKVREAYTTGVVRQYFELKEGEQITLPKRFLPSKKNLAKHRSLGDF